MLYVDDALDRRKDRITSEFESTIEAVRVGTVFAHNKEAYEKWQRHQRGRQNNALSDGALERAIMNLAQMFPGNVVRVPA